MISSKHLFPLGFFLIFLFPLRHALNPKKCSSSFYIPHRCGPLEAPIRFPLCDHAGFNLHCTDLNKTVLELPMSGTFLVHNIDYYKQQIYISDPENCLAKRLLTFNMSGSPFSSRFSSFYTFFSCPNDVVLPFSYRSIPCLNNSTSSFYATSNYEFVQIMFPSCQIVKRLHVPSPFGEIEFLSYVGNQSLMLEWVSPSCRSCEMEYLRCGFRKKSSLEVKCFGSKEPGKLNCFPCFCLLLVNQGNSINGKYVEEATCFGERFNAMYIFRSR